MWRLRRAFWNWLIIQKYKSNKAQHIPLPADDAGKLETIPLIQRYPGIPVPNIQVADRVPADEANRFKLGFCAFQARLGRMFPQNQPNLPPISSDLRGELDRAYTAHHRKMFPAPALPKEYEHPVDLGWLAVAGPYFCLLEGADEGGYQWDLRHLDGYPVHEGLRPLGVRVGFQVNKELRCLVAVEIGCDLGVVRPGDADWDLAQKIALCAATNLVSLIRHFHNIHLVAVAQFEVATRNNLGGAHPLRRLLWPHIWGTEYTNELVTELLMMAEGEFEGIFSFTHQGLCRLFQDGYEGFDIRLMDPEVDARQRGVLDGGFDTPALANRLAHLEVMRAHTRRYLDRYYPSDEDLRSDASVHAWLDELERRVPGGVTPLLGDPLSVDGLARMVAAFIYLGSVEHEVLGTGLWNYQLWTDVQPVRIYRNGQREPIDVYQRLVNYNFILNVKRAPLVQDFSYLGLDPEGAACFRTFFADLQALQGRLDEEEQAHWKMYPKLLEASVNG